MSSNRPNVIPFVMVCLALFFAGNALAVENPIPKEILDVTMGTPMETVAEKIASIGTNTRDSGKRRPKLIWTLPSDPYYQTVEFQFTENNRLFIIHFVLKNARRDDFQDLKKAFISNYNVSWDDPMRMRIGNSDVLFYQPEKGDIWFLDFTDKQNGDKAIELFDKNILSQDRIAYEAKKKAEAEQANQVKAQDEEKKDAFPHPADQNGQPNAVVPAPVDQQDQPKPAETQPKEGESPKASQ
jgi:hypothetical protein